MTDNYSGLIKIIDRAKMNLKIRELFKGFSIFLAVFIISLELASLLDYLLSLKSIQRFWILTIIIFAQSVLLLIKIIMPIIKPISDDETAIFIQKNAPELSDDPINALQLGRLNRENGLYVSADLIDALAENTYLKLRSLPGIEKAPLPLKKYLPVNIAAIIVFILLTVLPPHITGSSLPRLFNPFDYGKLSKIVKVLPGNAEVLYGSNIKIEAEVRDKRERVNISYRNTGGNWTTEKMPAAAQTTEMENYSYSFNNIYKDIEYYIKLNDIQSPIYRITVIILPEVGDITLTYYYPSYTGISEKVIENSNGDIEAIYGTRVDIRAIANKEIKTGFILTNDNKRFSMKVKNATLLEGSIYLTGESEYWIEAEDKQGYANNNPARHSITILKDESPQITILAPGMDLVVSEKSIIDMAFEVKDDFGVSSVDLVYVKSGDSTEGTVRVPVKKFNPAVDMKMFEYNWNLSGINLKPADLLSYYLEASDNDIISGPKKGQSKTYYIEIFSYEKEHSEIELMLEDFRKELITLLGDQILAKETVEKSRTDMSQEILENAAAQQQRVQENASDLIKMMEKLLPRMANDPLGDRRVYSEYENITNSLDYLKQGKMEDAVNQLKMAKNLADRDERNRQTDKITGLQQDIIEELEKMALISEDVLQSQKLTDLLNTGNEMLDKNTKLARSIEEMQGKADKEKLEQLKKALSDISELMQKMQRAMKDMPQELPEEFINQDSIKTMDVGKMNDMINELQSAIEKGDLDKALAKTMDMLKMLSEMMDMMQEAAGKVPSSDIDSLSKQTQEYSEELDSIIKQQEGIMKQTSAYDEKRMNELMKKQQGLLNSLAQLQKQAIEKTNILLKDAYIKIDSSEQRSYFSDRIRDALTDMQNVYQDLLKPPVRKAKEYVRAALLKLDFSKNALDSISTELQNIKNQDISAAKSENNEKKLKELLKIYSQKETNHSEIAANLKDISDTEKKILEALEKREQSNEELFNKNDKTELEKLSKQQLELKQRADSLRQGLKKLSAKTSAIGPDILGNIKDGAAKMREAGESLSKSDTGNAMESEQSALQYLSKGRDGLKSAGEQLSQMKNQMGSAKGGFIQQRGGASGGRMGLSDGRVKIPTPEDYQVPKELRQDIIESLKENYPEIYKEMINKYYKKLTE